MDSKIRKRQPVTAIKGKKIRKREEKKTKRYMERTGLQTILPYILLGRFPRKKKKVHVQSTLYSTKERGSIRDESGSRRVYKQVKRTTSEYRMDGKAACTHSQTEKVGEKL